MLKRKCKITYITHGATIFSEDFRLCNLGHYPPLDDKGQEEIQKICEYIKQRGVKSDKIYTSPSTRCIQSAQMIAKVHKQDFEIIPELTSRNWGDWDGLTFEKVIQKYSLRHEDGIPSIIALTPDNGEGIVEFNKRIDDIIHKDIVEKNIGNRVIVVTGQNVIQSVVATTLGIPPEKQSRIFIKTGSATQISYFDGWSSLIYSDYVPL